MPRRWKPNEPEERLMAGDVTYRLYQEADLPGMLRLWQEETEWGSLTPEEWRQWYLDTPFGEASTVVAARNGEGILGQFVFMPSLVRVNGRSIRALRPSAPIVTKTLLAALREIHPDQHPIAAMYRHATGVLQTRGYGLIYMLPDPRWLRALQMLPFLQCGMFPLWTLPVPLDAPLSLGPGYTAAPLGLRDKRIDALWEKASQLHDCLVVRNSQTLPWKVGAHAALGVEKDGELMGLVASRAKGDRQWLVCDLLAVDGGPSLRATLAAAANLAHARALAAPPEAPIRKAAVLVTPVLEPAARELGFARDAYDFPLAVHVLDTRLPVEEVAPQRWYVSAND
jgi:hypothetical protein